MVKLLQGICPEIVEFRERSGFQRWVWKDQFPIPFDPPPPPQSERWISQIHGIVCETSPLNCIPAGDGAWVEQVDSRKPLRNWRMGGGEQCRE